MSYFIKDIYLNDENYNAYNVEGVGKKIHNLSKINIFVGSNNSGKSRMLRCLFSENPLLFNSTVFELEALNEIIDKFKSEVTECINNFNILDYDNIIAQLGRIKNIEHIIEGDSYLDEFRKIVNKIKVLSGSNGVQTRGTTLDFREYELLNERLRAYAEKVLIEIEGYLPKKFDFKKVYIPTLRGLRTLEVKDNLYLKRTQMDYFRDQEQVEVFTGLDLYEEVKKLLLGNLLDREKMVEFQEYLGRVFFDGQQVTLIPSINSDVLSVKIGQEKEQPIFNLGDGIQSIIILTFPLFKYKNEKLLLFIEEPELYLHPGLQRKLLETMMSEGENQFQYFITTHSNHFLDLTLDLDMISIYSFKKELDEEEQKEKEANFIVENVSNEENNVLEMLGVRNSSVFLSNCTIWVEGITDRYYLRHYLNIYINSLEESIDLKEDYHYSFVEYSGNNITHWSFLDGDANRDEDTTFNSMNVDRLCSRLLLITDKDSQKKLARQQKLQETLEDRYYCLNCKEIENLLSKNVLLKVIAEYERVNVDDLEFRGDFSKKNYQNQYLGKFIDDKLANRTRRGKYGSASGTINDKVTFCKKAISHINSLDDLSTEAKVLCEKIYQFIKTNNQ